MPTSRPEIVDEREELLNIMGFRPVDNFLLSEIYHRAMDIPLQEANSIINILLSSHGLDDLPIEILREYNRIVGNRPPSNSGSVRATFEISDNPIISWARITVIDIGILTEVLADSGTRHLDFIRSFEEGIDFSDIASELVLDRTRFENMPVDILREYRFRVEALSTPRFTRPSPPPRIMPTPIRPITTGHCRRCDDPIDQTNMAMLSAKLCADCYQESVVSCHNCNATTSVNEGSHSPIEIEGEYYCDNCFSNNFFRCDDCGVVRLSGRTITCDNCGYQLCPNHTERHQCLNYNMYRPFYREIMSGKDKAKYLTTKRVVGVEIEVVNGNPKNIGKEIPYMCGISQDGSLKGRNPIEIQTPPSSGDMLEGIMLDIEDTLNKAKYEVNKTCGLHIHFDSSEFRGNAKKIRQILNTYYSIEPVIFAMLPKNRRKNQYSLPLTNWFSPSKIAEILSQKRISMPKIETDWYKTNNKYELRDMKGHKYDSSRYHGLNLHNLFGGKSLELRYHHGTINAKEIFSWINFNAKILDWSLNNYDSDKLVNILNAKRITDKFKKLVSYFELDRNTARYIRKSIIKNSK